MYDLVVIVKTCQFWGNSCAQSDYCSIEHITSSNTAVSIDDINQQYYLSTCTIILM